MKYKLSNSLQSLNFMYQQKPVLYLCVDSHHKEGYEKAYRPYSGTRKER